MKLFFETTDLAAYLAGSDTIDFQQRAVQEKIREIRERADTTEQRARLAFEFARDGIQHSFDTNSKVITICASEAIGQGEGICFAKSHALAALLRGLDIPAGFCYQRVTKKGTPESGYALHGLNAVYLPEKKIWFRVDPRGNKPGVQSGFSIDQERLAYPIRPHLGEIDYPFVFANPPQEVLAAMRESADCHELFHRRPEALALG